MRTTSLRLRVTVAVLALLALALLAVGILVNVVLGGQLRADLRQRLVDRAGYAQVLADQGLSPQVLADRLTGADIGATYVVDGQTLFGRTGPAAGPPGPPGGPAGRRPKGTAAVVQQSGSLLTVVEDVAGGSLTLTTSEADVDRVLARLRAVELFAGLFTLAITGLLLTRVVAVALRPLERMTALALGIAGGRRGSRLRPSNPRSEIGRTASAFDQMLAALETAETSARTAAAVATAAEEQMRQFLGDASHELRTPVAGLQASAETLLRDDPERARREQLALGMVRETRRAGRLVDDLLLMTRLERPGAPEPLPRRPVDLGELAGEVVARQRLLAPRQQLSLSAEPGVVVAGDPERLAQVLTNLLDNARHASPPDGRIEVSVNRTDGQASVAVTDSGPGVPAADTERIFDRFVRLDPGRSRAYGGSGLGLPIARALARAHGGTLSCATAAPVSARFLLTLPTAPAEQPVAARSGRRSPART